MRVSKALLCALTARVGLAVRQNLKVNQSGSLANVVETISALMEAKGKNAAHSKVLDNIRMLAAATPGQTEALNDALTQVILDIEEKVDVKIKAGFAESQAAAVTAINDLDAETVKALAEKALATQADEAWFQCIDVEKSKRVEVENALLAENQAIADAISPCQDQEDSKMFEEDPSVASSLVCDFEDPTDCTTKYTEYTNIVNGIVSKLKTDVEQATQKWTSYKNACDGANANTDAKVLAHTGAVSAWQSQKLGCQQQHEQRHLDLCSFATAFERKCETVSKYTDLIAKVESVGNEHSEEDREAEWKTTEVTKCMLNKVIAGVDLNGAAADACESTVNYAGSVGQFDKKESKFATLTSEAKLTCREMTITFYGQTWNLPAGSTPASTEYTTTPHNPEVDAFCEGVNPTAPVTGVVNNAPGK